jgi:uncharacterized protein YxjI
MYLIKERFFHLGKDSEITDGDGHVAFEVDGKVFSPRGRLVIKDPAGNTVAEVHRQLVALRPTYTVSVDGQRAARIHKRLVRLFRDRYRIDLAGSGHLSVKGSLLEHEFTIKGSRGDLATVSKRWISIHDTYAVKIADGENDLLILGIALALDLAEAREAENR